MTPDAIWYTDTRAARALRGMLLPLSALFRGVSGIRNYLYDHGTFPVIPSPVPTLSVGNLSVGGTGKTPVTAHIVRKLLSVGLHPAVVMRGYGSDESTVHTLLNPGVPVYADPDRVRGIAAAANAGVDVIVLDDGFQHRRAGRDADIVLVSAERWRPGEHVLPAGSLREPMRALRRASLVVVTHRVAAPNAVQCVVDAVRTIVPDCPVVPLHLAMCAVHQVVGGESLPLTTLSGTSIFAVAGIGDPESFFMQLTRAGAIVTGQRFADHHAYTASDVGAILAKNVGHKYIVTTLKDAVKLRPLWPAKAPPLLYVSQAVEESDVTSRFDTAVRALLLGQELS